MKDHVRALCRRSILTFFGTLYALALLLALFPPLYLWGSGISFEILGIPFAIMYWIIDAFALGLTLTAFYIVEDIRGELDDDSLEPVTENLGG
ncbi:MAG: hypothetical protein QOK12_1846 [Mycobacterium sp.]|nr:hypothetical protein [Mycobacterium sp.]